MTTTTTHVYRFRIRSPVYTLPKFLSYETNSRAHALQQALADHYRYHRVPATAHLVAVDGVPIAGQNAQSGKPDDTPLD